MVEKQSKELVGIRIHFKIGGYFLNSKNAQLLSLKLFLKVRKVSFYEHVRTINYIYITYTLLFAHNMIYITDTIVLCFSFLITTVLQPVEKKG